MRLPCVRPAICVSVVLVTAAPVSAQYTDWSQPVNLGNVVNSSSTDETPFLSRDGLHLYFSSNRPGGYGGSDIWVTTRESLDASWGNPVPLGPEINTAGNESHPTLSVDGHVLFFDRIMPITGTYDMFWSRRRDKAEEAGWETAVNAGFCINTDANDSAMIFFEDEATGITVTYFNSNRTGNPDIYATVYERGGTCHTVTPVADLNTPSVERNATIQRDALEILFESNRTSNPPNFDIWVSTRPTTLDHWSMPVNVSSLNSSSYDGRPALSWDGTELYFFSNRPGGEGDFDLYVSRREKLKKD